MPDSTDPASDGARFPSPRATRMRVLALTLLMVAGTVNYLDRTPDESMADDPTIPTTKTFAYTNGQLVEK